MALLKSEIIYNGSTVGYHRIVSIDMDMVTGAASAQLHSWVNKLASDRREPTMLSRRYNFVPTSPDVVSAAYAAIKSIPYWADAEDA